MTRFIPVATVDILPRNDGFSVTMLKGKKVFEVTRLLKTHTETRDGKPMSFLFILHDKDNYIIEKERESDDVFFSFSDLERYRGLDITINDVKGTLDSVMQQDGGYIMFLRLYISSNEGIHEDIADLNHPLARIIANAAKRHESHLRECRVTADSMAVHSKTKPFE